MYTLVCNHGKPKWLPIIWGKPVSTDLSVLLCEAYVWIVELKGEFLYQFIVLVMKVQWFILQSIWLIVRLHKSMTMFLPQQLNCVQDKPFKDSYD